MCLSARKEILSIRKDRKYRARNTLHVRLVQISTEAKIFERLGAVCPETRQQEYGVMNNENCVSNWLSRWVRAVVHAASA